MHRTEQDLKQSQEISHSKNTQIDRNNNRSSAPVQALRLHFFLSEKYFGKFLPPIFCVRNGLNDLVRRHYAVRGRAH